MNRCEKNRPEIDSHRQRLETRILELADELAPRAGMDRRRFLRSSCGLAAAFLALNGLHGPFFNVDPAEAADPSAGAARREDLSRQFIFDAQLHFVNEEYAWEPLLGLRRAAFEWHPELKIQQGDLSLRLFQFKNFVRQVFLESETDVGLLSSAPSDDPEKWFLHNSELAEARAMINSLAGSRRLLCHNVFTPGQPGWMEAVDRSIAEHRPDGWKGYTVGDPNMASRYPWRLDDEELVYPAYERMRRAGIRNVCVHKGILPPNYREKMPQTWKYARVDDVGPAARDWPDLNFIIYHSGYRSFFEPPQEYAKAFEERGYIPWVSELAEIPQKYGVKNVYAEIGSTFASLAVTHPRHCAAMLGTLIEGVGADKVLWGTDSIWYGSPQWQIEAFRRIEIPEDLQQRFGFSPLGGPDSAVRNAVLGLNGARLYGLSLEASGRPSGVDADRFARWEKRLRMS